MKQIPTNNKYSVSNCQTIIEFFKTAPAAPDFREEIAEKILALDENTDLFYIEDNGNLAILVGENGCGFSFSTLRNMLNTNFDNLYAAEMYDVFPINDRPGCFEIVNYDLVG